MNCDPNKFDLDPNHSVIRMRLPDELSGAGLQFEQLWRLHPEYFPTIFMHGRQVQLPRWQQAYGQDYYFSSKTSKALPVSEILCPFMSWGKTTIDHRLNGMLVNWYDGRMGHYIGAHRDSRKGLVEDSVIVMISLGGRRVMRFRPYQGKGYHDMELENGDVLIMDLKTNRHYKHEVPGFKCHQDRRISITLRCFEQQRVDHEAI